MWMAESEPPSVQRLPGQLRAPVALSVDGIVEDRVANGGEVHAYLVRASRFEAED